MRNRLCAELATLSILLSLVMGLSSDVIAETPSQPAEALKPAEIAARQVGKSAVSELTQQLLASTVVVTPLGRDGQPMGIGAGVVISTDGLIATNRHVIQEARPIKVRLNDGREFSVTHVHATAKAEDLAIIRIDAEGLQPLELGDSDAVETGTQIVAIGSPQGLDFSVVHGVVSGRREIEGMDMLQLAIPIESGNSGGPVCDLSGHVIGLVTLKSLVTKNLGFAVAANTLRPLLEQPNPIPIEAWQTIGALRPLDWQPLFGANWRQRAGRIIVDGVGDGFGGRSICLWQRELPKKSVDVAVTVRLEDEEGAAGLIFHCDGEDKHYGFYPSNGQLRLSRFDGPDVFSWQVLEEVASAHYRPGEWNTLKIRLQPQSIKCYVNDHLVIESRDSQYIEGSVGLAKFRDTTAEFKRFRVAERLPDDLPAPDVRKQIRDSLTSITPGQSPSSDLLENLSEKPAAATFVLRQEADALQQRAEQLRQLASQVEDQATVDLIRQALDSDRQPADLLTAALGVARLQNTEIDVAAYQQAVDGMVEQVRSKFPPKAGLAERLAVLDRYLFEEQGFHGSRTDYYNRSNSYLNEVIDDREGLPISLSVLYLEMCRRLEIPVVGVGLPGHYVVRFEPPDGTPELLDVFDRGKRITQEEAAQRVLSVTGRLLSDKDLQADTPKSIIVRMLRNLVHVCNEEGDTEAVLRFLSAMVQVDPTLYQERAIRAAMLAQESRYQESQAAIEALLAEEPARLDKDRLRALQEFVNDQIAQEAVKSQSAK